MKFKYSKLYIFFKIVFFLPQNETKTDIIKEGERYFALQTRSIIIYLCVLYLLS